MIYGYWHDYGKTMSGDGKNNDTQIQTNSKFMQNLELLIWFIKLWSWKTSAIKQERKSGRTNEDKNWNSKDETFVWQIVRQHWKHSKCSGVHHIAWCIKEES